MCVINLKNYKVLYCLVQLLAATWSSGRAHEAKDFDDTILYRIEFDFPDFEKNPELQNNIKTFYTHEHEKYDCVIPLVEDMKEEQKPKPTEVSPLKLLTPIFSSTVCSYRIEAFWSYEICHGYHIRQYHEEREGKVVKFQEYFLGNWNEQKTEALAKTLEDNLKAGHKYRTLKIDNVKYPYIEMEMTNGTLCDINNEARSTKVRYVCYPNSKNDVYSFKETSSCNYEAIILTSLLCADAAFHAEESKEFSIKCFNSPTDTHKPLSMLRQELAELQLDEDLPVNRESFPVLLKPSKGDNSDTFIFGSRDQAGATESALLPSEINLAPIKELLSGKNCLTGGNGWWKYEFCHRVHVRQFHHDKKGDAEIYLGYFNEAAHKQWIDSNADKAFKRGTSTAIWHHYEGGKECDRTGKPREVDVKLTCSSQAGSPTAVSMYLLEPKTCQYILVVESPIICDLMQITDEYGLVDLENYQNNKNEAQTKIEPDKTSDSEEIKEESATESAAEEKTNVDELPVMPPIMLH